MQASDLQSIQSELPGADAPRKKPMPLQQGPNLPRDSDRNSSSWRMEDSNNDERLKTSPGAEAEAILKPEKQDRVRKSQRQRRLVSQDKGDGEEEIGSEFSTSTSESAELDPQHSDNSASDGEETALTSPNRRKRKGWKRFNRDVGALTESDASRSISTKRLADRNLIKSLLINSLLVLSWYLFSLSISIYNKWMFSSKYLDFHFPLFTTCLHMLVQFCLALLVLLAIPQLRPQPTNTSLSRGQPPSMKDAFFSQGSKMTAMFYLTRISPCGTATGLDIGLGNMSLKFITLTFYTMCKSSSLAFVLTFAFLFRLESPSIKLIAIIATMTIGVVMMVAGEVEFDILGFILVILAAFFSGFRWSLTQILLLRSPATSNPFSSIMFLAPVMFLSLAIIAFPVEGAGELAEGLGKLVELKGVPLGVGILLFPGLLAFLMTASEFALLQRTSVVTLSICGIFKEVVTISAAGIVFHDPLTPINVSGLLITIASIAAYNYLKISTLRQRARTEIEQERQQDYVLAGEDLDEDHQLDEGRTRLLSESSETPAIDSDMRR